MREAADYSIFFPRHEPRDATSLLLTDLLSLMQRIETNIRLNDLAIAVLRLESNDLDCDFFILDGGYVFANVPR
jgi:hypothetical protein